MTGRLTDSDKSTAVVYKFIDCRNDGFICPVISTGVSSISVTYVQDNVDIFQHIRILTDIIKSDKTHIKRCTTQRFHDSCIRIVLFVIDCMMNHMIAPCTHLTPAVQHCYSFYTVWCSSFDIFI